MPIATFRYQNTCRYIIIKTVIIMIIMIMNTYIYNIMNTYVYIIEGSLEVKLPTIWTDEKQSREEAERRERSEERRCRCAKR